MESATVDRKLVAILAADVAGYSRLMSEDEEGTLHTLNAYREVVDALVARHKGRIANTAGDSILAEFPSPVEAVRCAGEIQAALETHNRALPEARRLRFRIGVNLGDVITKGGDLLGDGVNVAARLQALAEPGGVLVSGSVFDQVEGKLDLGFTALGKKWVKNITKPVRVYRVEPARTGGVAARARQTRRGLLGWPQHRAAILAFVASALLVLAAGAWITLRAPSMAPSSVPGPDLAGAHGKPLVAVLPFANLSGDPTQDYFSDGVTEDIIVALGRFSNLSVMARNAVFQFKGKNLKHEEISRELGVRYVIEGSVRKVGERIRVTAQLSDAMRGTLLWSERYDDELKNVFARQDEIMRSVVGALTVKVTRLEQERAFATPTDSLEAYDYVLRGRYYLRRATRSANIEAGKLFERAIQLDPGYADGHAELAAAIFDRVLFGWTDTPEEDLERVEGLVKKALGLDNYSASAHRLLGRAYLVRLQYDMAITEAERAIALNPSDAESHAIRGHVLLWSGRLDEAILALETAMRFDPSTGPKGFADLGMAYYLMQRYAAAAQVLERSLQRYPDFPFIHITLAATYGQLGRAQDAARAVDSVRRLQPFFEASSYAVLLKNPTHRNHLVEGLHKAGLN